MLIRRLWLVVTTILFCGIATISGQANMEKNLVVNNQNAMTLSQPLSQRLRASQNLMPNLVANAVVNDADSTSDDGKIADEGVFGTCHWIQYNNGLVTFDGGEMGEPDTGDLPDGSKTRTVKFLSKVKANPDSTRLFAMTGLETIENLSYLDTSEVTNMSFMFAGCGNLKNVKFSDLNTSNVTDMSYMFAGMTDPDNKNEINLDLSNWNTSKVRDMSNMFFNYAGGNSIRSINFGHIDTSNVTNMTAMFMYNDSIENLDLSGFDTSNVTNMNSMFFGDSGLKSVALDNFDTSKVTSMISMFGYCSSLVTVDVSKFDTSSVAAFQDMFVSCSSLENVDVSGFKTSAQSEFSGMFKNCASLQKLDLSQFMMTNFYSSMLDGCRSLSSIKTGSLTRFDVGVPNIDTVSGRYTGRWIGENTRNTYASSDAFMADYDGSKPDTYIWEGYPGKDVTVKYENQLGNEIHTSQTITGYAEDDYDATTENYKLSIDGYDLDTDNLPANAIGQFNLNNPQTVTYKYNRTAAKPVTVNYQDSSNHAIHDPKIITGYINDDYDVSTADYQLKIPGYDLDRDQLPDNLTGKLSDTAKTITYSYKRAGSAGVTVSYQDADGKTLHADQHFTGKIGDPFDVTTADYQLAIEGYRLDQKKLPNNMTGELTDKEQTVIYQYQKLPATAQPVTVKYVDLAQKQLHADQQITGKVGDHYDASTSQYQLVIDGYELDTSQLPGNLKGAFGEAAQTVTYVYRPKIVPIPTPSKGVLVRYVDGHNRDLQAAKTLSGKVGDAYDVSTTEYQAKISGYELDTSNLPVNQKGKFTEQLQTVTYVYQPKSILPVQAGLVTVKYVDPDGKAVHADQTISGLIGKPYDASTTDYQLVIEGYKLDQAKLPTNRKGILSNQAQTVTYIYQKQSVTVPSEPQQPATTKPKDKVTAKPVAKTTTKVKPDQAADDAIISQNSVAKKSATKALPTAATYQVNRTNRKLPRTSEQHQVTKRVGLIGLLSLLLLVSGSYYWRQR